MKNFVLFACSFFLLACGQKGDLYLPEEEVSKPPEAQEFSPVSVPESVFSAKEEVRDEQ